MQSVNSRYGAGFAKAYDARWSSFAAGIAPLVHKYYETACPNGDKSLLDICCGTGQLSLFFLQKGYRVAGIDASEAMLSYARNRAADYVAAGQAQFIEADAADFRVDGKFGLATSTYDSLNHLPNEEALASCARRVLEVCEGMFVFDLNTRRGLRRWNGISVDDADEAMFIVNRGIYDGQADRAWVRITGFVRTPGGSYERFDETAFNSVFDLDRVRQLLLDVGWQRVHITAAADLTSPVPDPESLGRAFFIAFAPARPRS
jgi:SAM-dependent methyltransferase